MNCEHGRRFSTGKSRTGASPARLLPLQKACRPSAVSSICVVMRLLKTIINGSNFDCRRDPLMHKTRIVLNISSKFLAFVSDSGFLEFGFNFFVCPQTENVNTEHLAARKLGAIRLFWICISYFLPAPKK